MSDVCVEGCGNHGVCKTTRFKNNMVFAQVGYSRYQRDQTTGLNVSKSSISKRRNGARYLQCLLSKQNKTYDEWIEKVCDCLYY